MLRVPRVRSVGGGGGAGGAMVGAAGGAGGAGGAGMSRASATTTARGAARGDGATVGVAGGATTTGDALDLGTALGLAGVLRIVNGGTAPTAPCSAFIDVSGDGMTWRQWTPPLTAGLTASATYQWSFDLPAAVMYVRARFVGNTGQAVTVDCLAQELTGL